jgi:hypothetical protein
MTDDVDPTPPGPGDVPPDSEGEEIIETPDVATDDEPDHALAPDPGDE